ncbi:transporter substrate-binding domain-containing protein [Desulfogranum mediterraneum]|uniref:transporter substrate-binding domain-containing protein n=1 Tax=Desulfogranum mediterraneum TaxID=160661 RepID=UPI00041ED975|nr:transporter substrate-binding domain-containing protein [Desulfogranum mediterraneum]
MRHLLLLFSLACFALSTTPGLATDLEEVLARGGLRHLQIPYANFNLGDNKGLSHELMKGFADALGVKYVAVTTTWNKAIGDLTASPLPGKEGTPAPAATPRVRGDVIASGFTILPWREELVAFSLPVFPTQVWLVAASNSPLSPITPGAGTAQDILQVKQLLRGKTVLGKKDTCLDPCLYELAAVQAQVRYFSGGLNDLAPAILRGEADAALLDVPDALIALEKWPGQIKIIGPISPQQQMAVGFRHQSPRLRAAFNRYFTTLWQDGSYQGMVRRHYPHAARYFPAFFAKKSP